MAAKESTTAAEIEQEPTVTATDSGTPGLSEIAKITENEEQMGLVRDYAPPVLAIIASSLTWASVSAPFIGTVTVSGFATDVGYLLSLFALGVMAAVYTERTKARLIASGLAAASTVLGFLYLLTEMGGGGELVQTGFGMGMYLAIAASAAMLYFAYQAHSAITE